MKKFLIVVVALLVVFIAAAIILPVIFKEDIKAAIDKELDAAVNADILFDVENFNLSLFTNFPNITATMKEFGVINRAPFEGEILFATEELEVEINLMSIISGETPRIKGISLIRPIINVLVKEDGSANYDIAVASEEEETVEVDTAASEFSFGIDHWEIIDGSITYDDKSMPFLLKLEGFNHSGSGDFTQASFDLNTITSVDSLTLGYDGDLYMEKKQASIDMVISISENFSKYTFKENTAKINDFAMGFDGWFLMADDYFDMDITYSGKENTFKSLLSLVPGMYSSDFSSLTAEGILSFDGMVKGKYDDNTMPAFNVGLQVNDGMFQYPDLPTAVKNVNIDMLVDNKDGVIDNTSIDIKKFHMDFGNNPIDAVLSIANLTDYRTKANIKASLNLAELNQMFPIEGLDMKGIFAMNLNANGTYDSTMNTMPILSGAMSLNNGFVKSSEFPIPLEDLHFESTFENKSGKMEDFALAVNDFTMIMDKEEFHSDILFNNLVNYTWKITASGGVDLQKITAIFPLEGMELAGLIKANLETSGDMAAVDAEAYGKLPTSGDVSISNFVYKDVTLPYDVTISTANASFNPREMQLKSFDGKVGKSDMKMSGSITNYIGYALNDNEVLKGTLDFSSNMLDLNEMMPEEEESATTIPADTTSYSVIPVPKNIDFTLNSNIKKMIFMDFNITDATGSIIVRDGVANLSNLKFNMLGGTFKVGGTYDTKDMAKPGYDLKLGIENLSISESFKAFSMVQKFAPLAKSMTGKVSSDFNISGLLQQDFMPKLETVSGGGVLKIVQAALTQESKFVTSLTSVTKLDDAKEVTLKDVVMAATIENGRLNVKPFDFKFGNYPAKVEGSTGMDGSIDYKLKMDVPAGKLGSAASGLTSQLGLGNVNENTIIPLNLGMGGTALEPKIQLLGSDAKAQIKDAAVTKAKEEAKTAATDAVKELTDGKDAGSIVGSLLNSDSTKANDSTKIEVKEAVEDKAKETIQNLFKNRKNKN